MKKIYYAIAIIVLLLFSRCVEKQFEKKTYTVGVDTTTYPFSYKDEKTGKITGFEYDLLVEISKRADFKLNFEEMLFANILEKIKEKNIDIGIGVYSITDERKKIVDFSDSYLISDVIVVGSLKNKNKDIKNPIYAVEKGTYFKSLVKKGSVQEDVFGDKIVDKILSNEVDYAIFDKVIGLDYIKKNPGLYEKEVLKRDYIGVAISKEFGREFNRKINTILQSMKADGTLKELKQKYNIVE